MKMLEILTMQPLASSSELLLADPFLSEKHMYREYIYISVYINVDVESTLA